MAHFARVEDGTVTQVIVISNDVLLDESGTESEFSGQEFIATLGLEGTWVQTSYNGNPVAGHDRGPYAGVGFLWDGSTFTDPNFTSQEAIA